jgi:hypothetical protein
VSTKKRDRFGEEIISKIQEEYLATDGARMNADKEMRPIS